MTDKPDPIKLPAQSRLPAPPKERPLPRRPSYQRVIENIDKWVSSSGLQKPT